MQRIHTFIPYLLSLCFICGWWIWAFFPASTPYTFVSTPKSSPPLFASLSPLDRDTLQYALAGDWSLMAKLIADWDIDAQLLEKTIPDVQRLPRDGYLRSQLLGRQLHDTHSTNSLRVLPQTYVAASFLLALTQPTHIVALPRGLRSQTTLFPKQLTDQIPLDIDRYNAEALFLAHPQVAFVANYSDPATLEALRHQGVEIFTLQESHAIADIQHNLIQIGHIIKRPLEAELLTLFIEAALQAMDNHLLALKQEHPSPSHPLFVTYRTTYSVPAKATLTSQFLQRLNIEIPSVTEDQGWTHPITQEQILQCNPDCLIVASSHQEKVQALLGHHPALITLPATQQGKFFIIDDAIQQFPSQYIVLAYYDLYTALVTSHLL